MWYSSLASQLEGVTASKAQGIILKSLEKLDTKEKENILVKMEGAETNDIAEQNQVSLSVIPSSTFVHNPV